MTSQIEAGLRVIRVVGNASSILDISNAAEKAHTAAKILSFTIEIERVLNHFLGLEILGPPLVKSWILKTLNERLKPVNHV